MNKITKIEFQKKNQGRYSIYIDGEFAFGVHEDVLVQHSLRKGMELDDEQIELICESEKYKKAYMYGINLLSYKMRTEKELSDKMREKEHSEEAIEDAISKLRQKGYVDDGKYALMYANEKMNKKASGRKLVSHKLRQKGIDSEIVSLAIEEVSSEDKEYEQALDAAAKKMKTTYRNDDKNAVYRKLGGYLSRRGYPYSIVSRVLREVLKNQ